MRSRAEAKQSVRCEVKALEGEKGEPSRKDERERD
jgi:hypothetical protein